MTTITAPPPSRFGVCTRCGARRALTNLDGGLCRGKYSNSPDSCVAAVARERAAAAAKLEQEELLQRLHKKIVAAYTLHPVVRKIGATTLYSDSYDRRGVRIAMDAGGNVSIRISNIPASKAITLLEIAQNSDIKAKVMEAVELLIEKNQVDHDDLDVIHKISEGELCSKEILKTMEAAEDHDPGDVEAAFELARTLNSTYPNLEDVFKDASQKNPALRGLYFQVSKLYELATGVG